MALEVCQVYHIVVVLDVRTYDVILDPLVIFHRNLDFTFFVHDVNMCYGLIASLGNLSAMRCSIGTGAFIGCVALY